MKHYCLKKSLFLVCLIIGFTAISCRTKTDAEVDESISKSFVLERVNKFCNNLPKPNDFIYVNKQIGGNAVRRALGFNYLSKKPPRETVAFYIKWANENGWTVIRDNEYIKANQSIVVSFEYFPTSNVHIGCEEKVQ